MDKYSECLRYASNASFMGHQRDKGDILKCASVKRDINTTNAP